MKKLQARNTKETKKTVRIDLTSETLPPSSAVQKTIGVINVFNSSTDTIKRDRAMTLDTLLREVNLCFFKLKSYFLNFRLKNKNV